MRGGVVTLFKILRETKMMFWKKVKRVRNVNVGTVVGVNDNDRNKLLNKEDVN